MKRRHAILLFGGASAGALSVGTGAFSSVEAERGMEVNVVDDDEAYLGLEQVSEYVPSDDNGIQTDESTDHDPNDVVRVTNKFAHPLDLTVTVESTDGVVDGIEVDDALADDSELGVGEKGFVAIECEDAGGGHVELSFDGETGGATVEATREFVVSCLEVEFKGESGRGSDDNGGGSVHVSGEFTDLDVTVNGESRGSISSDGDNPAVLTPDGGKIDSVTIDGVTYKSDGTDRSDE
jgi:hypothetical protein